jgi:hypothetical protein
MDENAQAFAGRRFEVAYHALAAAMHRVHDLQDPELLSAVHRFAQEQGGGSTRTPRSTSCPRKARRLGVAREFLVSMAGEAKAMLLGLKADDQAERLRLSSCSQRIYPLTFAITTITTTVTIADRIEPTTLASSVRAAVHIDNRGQDGVRCALRPDTPA